jgi:MFS family permease
LGRYRWLILTAGTLAATSLSAVQVGISAITPALRSHYGLSIGEIGVVIAATNAGMVLTLLAWGIVSDRFGERIAIVLGLTGSAISLVVAANAKRFRGTRRGALRDRCVRRIGQLCERARRHALVRA